MANTRPFHWEGRWTRRSGHVQTDASGSRLGQSRTTGDHAPDRLRGSNHDHSRLERPSSTGGGRHGFVFSRKSRCEHVRSRQHSGHASGACWTNPTLAGKRPSTRRFVGLYRRDEQSTRQSGIASQILRRFDACERPPHHHRFTGK